MMKYWGGADPGKDGAIVIIDSNRNIVAKTVMPVIFMGKGGKREFDPAELDAWLNAEIVGTELHDDIHFVIEKSQVYPKQGGVSNHSTGMGDMLLWSMMVSHWVSFERIPPQHWQKVMFAGIAPGNPKKRALIKAKQLFPNEKFYATDRCRKAHDGLVDAALLAVYGMMTYGAKP
jgi:hypothetical protein